MSDIESVEPAQVPPPPSGEQASREGLPTFAKEYPADDELLSLARAYERGDFRGVTQTARALLKVKTDPEVVKAIHELVARTKPDPLSVALIALTALLLLSLAGYWMLHDGPEGQRAPNAPTSH